MSDTHNLLGGSAAEPDVEARPGEARIGEARAEAAVEGRATALALEEAQSDPAARPAAAALLTSQKTLVDLQIAHFEEERRLAQDERRLAIGAAYRKRFFDRLRNGLQLFVAIAATAVAVVALVMIYDAATSRRVVVDPFAAPPALAPRGVTGEVVAAGVLDQLLRLQDATRSARKGLKTTNAWSEDVKIQVPQTGVSIGEIDRTLHQRLGQDVHIGGELVQTPTGGLALTVRGDGVPARTFEGAAGDLGTLTRQGAEYVYGRSQPTQFAIYLTDNHRNAEAIAFIPEAFARVADAEARSRLANTWGAAYFALNNRTQAAAKYRLAMALDPPNWSAWGNLVSVLPSEEAQWRESRKFLQAAQSAPRAQRPELRLWVNPAANVLDMPLVLAANLQDATHNAGAGADTKIDGPAIADAYGLMHDQASASRYMAQSDPDDPFTKAEALVLAGYAALDRGDFAAASPPLEAYWKAWLVDPELQSSIVDMPCLTGLALGMTGRLAEAEAAFKRVGPWSRCYAAQGDVLEHAGDLAGAERVWAEGLRIAPDLPSVYLHRGISETRRGDFAAAAADLAAANRSAPHWADPLKAWGDLLAGQGRWREAAARYDAALKYAPAWPDLRRARQQAARHSS